MAGEKGSIFEGKTLDDAVRMGLDALGLSRAEVMITVLEEGSGGFLGLGARPYKVRVMPRPGGPPREPGERGDGDERRRGGRGRRERQAGEGRGESGRMGRREARAGDRRGPRAGGREGPAPVPERGPEGEGGSRRRRRGRRGGRGRGERPMPAAAGSATMAPGSGAPHPGGEPAAPPEPRPEREARDPMGGDRQRPGLGRPAASTLSEADLEARATQATVELLRAMGFEARLSAHAEGDNVDVTAEISEGEDLLIGRKGEVRQALQHLLNLTVNRGEGMRYHLQLEVNDFWRRRETELKELAQSMADQALSRGSEVLTDYLNAQERRIIHVTLREDGRVKTYAIGDGLIKKLAVAPADQPEVVREGD